MIALMNLAEKMRRGVLDPIGKALIHPQANAIWKA